MELSDKDRRRERFNRRKKSAKQRKRNQYEQKQRQFNPDNYVTARAEDSE